MERSLPSERCGDAARLCELLARIEALAVVNGSAIIQEQYNNGAGRIIVNLWCRANHNASSDKQPYVNLNKKPASDPTAVPTYEVAAAKLPSLLETKHASCLEAAEAAKAAAAAKSKAGADAGSSAGVNATEAMMRLAAAKVRAATANKAALEAEKAKDAAEEEVEALRRAIDPKRARTEAGATDEAAESDMHIGDWDLSDHRREATRLRNRRAVRMGSRDDAHMHTNLHASGHTLLQRRARSRDQAVAAPRGRGRVGPHLRGVGPDKGHRHRAASSGNACQLKRVACCGLQAQGSPTTRARSCGTQRQAHTRCGAARACGHGPHSLCAVGG